MKNILHVPEIAQILHKKENTILYLAWKGKKKA